MAKRRLFTDFRATRALLPDEAFALVSGKRPEPTDLVAEDVWNGIMHLPDDVAITTSSHHGSQLAALYSLWGDWLKAMGDEHDELFIGMLDAADCFQASTFDSLHGYYRSAMANLRSAVELVAIGSLGNLSPNDRDYLRWKKQNVGSLPFATVIRKLRGVTKTPLSPLIFKPNGWVEALYNELCAYTHSRPDSTDGEMWRSNGPIYVTAAFNLVFKLQASTYATCYVLAKVGRPHLVLPSDSKFLFTTPKLLWRDDIASSYRVLCSIQGERDHAAPKD
jgi:hypothetical protein